MIQVSKRLVLLVLLTIETSPLRSAPADWISLFDGKTLDGWTPKFAKHETGENILNTFRVEDGILKVSYDEYETFDGRYGHLYSNHSYSRYILRMDYRFEGGRMADAPHYVNLNSGLMIHSQPPHSMALDQSFPVSLEFQFLADEGNGPRSTGNVCTPGTNLVYEGQLSTDHIIESTAPTFPSDEWVSIEIEVRGNEEVIHRVNGEDVLRYQQPQLDPSDGVEAATPLIEAGLPLMLSHGHIALQAEGQGVWFRNIELLPLED